MIGGAVERWLCPASGRGSGAAIMQGSVCGSNVHSGDRLVKRTAKACRPIGNDSCSVGRACLVASAALGEARARNGLLDAAGKWFDFCAELDSKQLAGPYCDKAVAHLLQSGDVLGAIAFSQTSLSAGIKLDSLNYTAIVAAHAGCGEVVQVVTRFTGVDQCSYRARCEKALANQGFH